MQYMGGKSALAKKLLPYILKNHQREQWFIDAFMGGGSIICKAKVGNRWGNDIHPQLMALYRALQNGWQPPIDIDEDEYKAIKANPHLYQDRLVAFAGFACSYGGKWMDGFARNKNGMNYAKAGHNTLIKQAEQLSNVKLTTLHYKDIKPPNNSIIYCDPPYEDSTQYKTGAFDHQHFWQWCRRMASKGHEVFVSSYKAPDDITCILELKHRVKLDCRDNRKFSIERLYKV